MTKRNSSSFAVESHGWFGQAAYGRLGLGARWHCYAGPAPEMEVLGESTKQSTQSTFTVVCRRPQLVWTLAKKISDISIHYRGLMRTGAPEKMLL